MPEAVTAAVTVLLMVASAVSVRPVGVPVPEAAAAGALPGLAGLAVAEPGAGGIGDG